MKTPKGNKFIDELMLLIVAIAVGAVAVLNLCQTDRPTYSEIENRDLATMPELTGESLLDGSFFSLGFRVRYIFRTGSAFVFFKGAGHL